MRWFVLLILLFALLWFLRGLEETPPPKAEDSFIGEPVKVLRKMEGYEEEYLDQMDEHKRKMEEQVEKDSGGGN